MINTSLANAPAGSARPPESDLAVDMQGMTKTFRTPDGKLTAVDDVSLSIKTGSIVALLGPNGAGKNTAIDLILVLNTRSSGKLPVMGHKPRRTHISRHVP